MEMLGDSLNNLNWIAVLLATASTFVVGFAWYDLRTFGTTWMKQVGITKKQMESSEGMGKTFGFTGLQSFATAILLGCVLNALAVSSVVDSILVSLLLGVVFRGGTHVMHNGFARRSDTLTLIDASHDAVALAVMGLIFGLFF